MNIVLHAEWATDEENALAEVDNMMFIQKLYPAMDFSEVGLFAKSKYELVIVFDNPVVLLNEDGSLSYKAAYNLASLPLVKKDLYEKYKHEPQIGSSLWTTTYDNDVESTASWGPYKLVEYQKGKYYKLVKNEYWYGYDMDEYAGQYQTDEIYTETISDYNTELLKFKAGELDAISIDVSVADVYRNSSQAIYTKDDFASSLQIQSSYDALKERESEGKNKTILTYRKFRKAMSLSINRSAFAQQCTTSNMEGYGLLNDAYYYDVENGKIYRNTDAAKIALCDVYGVDYTAFETLDDAVGYINAYDLEQARKLVTEAYEEALAAGDIKETDVVSLVFGTQTATENMTRQFEFYRDCFVEMCKGTKLEGRIELTFEAKGTTWATDFRQGKYDICGGGWTGGDWDPGYILICYISPDYTYATAWDTSKHELTATISGLNEYAQVCDANGNVTDTELRRAIARETSKTNPEPINLDEFELYASLNQILSYACSQSYSLSYYYKYYPNLFKKDGVDNFAKLNSMLGTEEYILVTEEVKQVLRDIAYSYYSSKTAGDDFSWAWYTFCFYKPDVVETTLTMTLTEWYNCLNGISGAAFNWAEGYASDDARVQIMAALEGEILKQYYSVPLTYRYSAELISYKLRRKKNLTILFISHDLSVVKYFSDRIAVMYFGRIVEMAASSELFEHPLHPYTKSLLSAIPLPDPDTEKLRQRTSYNPLKDHDYSVEAPALREIVPGHFISCNSEEFERYKKEFR